MKELKHLTGLRFLAALYVFIFHMYIHGYVKYLPKGIDAIVSQGALGVSIFFVLSGFLLAYSHLKDFGDGKLQTAVYYRRFMAKRIARIYPVYFVGVLLALLGSFGLQDIPANLPLLTSLNVIMIHSWVPRLAMQWYGGGSWSISTEMFFYLNFPLLMPILVRIEKKKVLFLTLCIIILISAIPGLIYNYSATSDPGFFQLVYTFPPARIAEFTVGIITGLLVLRFEWKVPNWAALLALASVSIYLARFGFRMRGFVGHNVVVLPAVVALLGCLAYSPSSIAFRWLGSRVMLYLGRISYSFYIVQIVLLDATGVLWKRGAIPHSEWWIMPFLFIVNIFAAIVIYEAVEKRLHMRFLSVLLPKKLHK